MFISTIVKKHYKAMPPNIVRRDLVHTPPHPHPQSKPYAYCIANRYVVNNLNMANTQGRNM